MIERNRVPAQEARPSQRIADFINQTRTGFKAVGVVPWYGEDDPHRIMQMAVSPVRATFDAKGLNDAMARLAEQVDVIATHLAGSDGSFDTPAIEFGNRESYDSLQLPQRMYEEEVGGDRRERVIILLYPNEQTALDAMKKSVAEGGNALYGSIDMPELLVAERKERTGH